MAYGWWDSGCSLSESRSGQTVTLTLSGTARYGDSGSRSWSFRLYKNGSATSTYFTGYSTTGGSYGTAVFSGSSVTYTLSGSDIGTTVSFRVVGTCNGDPFFTESDGYPVPTASISVPSASVSWASGASITAVPTNDLKVKVTRTKAASVGGGYSGTVYYRVWCESTRKNNDGDPGSTWTVTPNSLDTELTYKVQAYAVVWGRTFTSSTLTAKATVESGNYLSYYNGSQWIKCKAFYYTGTQWKECKPYYYNGSQWVECSS